MKLDNWISIIVAIIAASPGWGMFSLSLITMLKEAQKGKEKQQVVTPNPNITQSRRAKGLDAIIDSRVVDRQVRMRALKLFIYITLHLVYLIVSIYRISTDAHPVTYSRVVLIASFMSLGTLDMMAVMLIPAIAFLETLLNREYRAILAPAVDAGAP